MPKAQTIYQLEQPHILPAQPAQNQRQTTRIHPELISKAIEISRAAALIRSRIGEEQDAAVSAR